jgi:hypothetical protein
MAQLSKIEERAAHVEATPVSGLSGERARQISVENQSGPIPTGTAVKDTAGSALPHAADVLDASILAATQFKAFTFPIGGGIDKLAVPDDITFAKNSPGFISDCATGVCIVNGKRYFNNTDIPGNKPVALQHPDGTPVLAPDGHPIMGPDRANLDQIADGLKNMQALLGTEAAVAWAKFNFRHGGNWDFQRMTTDGLLGFGKETIFTDQYKDFANVAIGYAFAALGLNLDQIATMANSYCANGNCTFREPMSKQYPNIPERLVKEYETGIKLYQERHPQGSR